MKSISNSEKLIQWADAKIDGLEISSDDRPRIVASCLDIALEHQKAIILLIANELYGSAFALIRLLFEAYVRGLWLNYCANDKEIEKFKKGKLDKKFGKLIEDIEKVDGYNVGTLSSAKQAGWKVMNSFTHSGFNQIIRRNTESSIEPNYEIEGIEEAINFANAIGLLSCLEISFLAKKEKLSIEILEKVKEIKVP
jgi:hypothetical protein